MMIWDGLPSAAISLFSLFFPEIISGQDPVFGGNPGPPPVELPAEQGELSLFRRCFSLFFAVLVPRRTVDKHHRANRVRVWRNP
jgi:hypothetical protein